MSLYIMSIARTSTIILSSTRHPTQKTDWNVHKQNRRCAAEGGCIHSSAVGLADPFSRATSLFTQTTNGKARTPLNPKAHYIQEHYEIS